MTIEDCLFRGRSSETFRVDIFVIKIFHNMTLTWNSDGISTPWQNIRIHSQITEPVFFLTNFHAIKLTKSHIKKSYLKVLKLPRKSWFFYQHMETHSTWTGKLSGKHLALWAIDSKNRKHIGSKKVCLGEWKQIKTEIR